MTAVKAAFPSVRRGSDSEHGGRCEEVNYNYNPAQERGWHRGLRSPGWPGSCRLHPMGARGDTWPLGAASRGALLPQILLLSPQILPGLLGSSPRSGTGLPGTPHTGGFAVPPC